MHECTKCGFKVTTATKKELGSDFNCPKCWVVKIGDFKKVEK